MDSNVIELTHPVAFDGIEARELEMRPPTVGDMLRLDKAKGTDAEKELRIIADLCRVSPQEMHAMAVSDYTKLQRRFAAFFRAD